jgi:Leucine-rich repeat (LRR) protein
LAQARGDRQPLVLSLLFVAAGAMACQSPTAPVLQAGESCEGQPRAAVATFADANLAARVMAALGVPTPEYLTCGRLAQLTDLDASGAGVTSLVGIRNLTGLLFLDISENPIGDASLLESLPLRILFARAIGLTSVAWIAGLGDMTFLDLGGNSITDVGPLGGLGELTFLDLRENSVASLAALSGLSLLRFLYLDANSISDIGPLGALTTVTTLSLRANSITELGALQRAREPWCRST